LTYLSAAEAARKDPELSFAFTPHVSIDDFFLEHTGYADDDYTNLAFQAFEDAFTGILLFD
jgi:hypothetical protein